MTRSGFAALILSTTESNSRVGVGCGIALIALSAGDRGSSADAVVGILLIVAAAIVGILMGRVVYAQKIDEKYVWLKGCGAEFLDSLPPLP